MTCRVVERVESRKELKGSDKVAEKGKERLV